MPLREIFDRVNEGFAVNIMDEYNCDSFTIIKGLPDNVFKKRLRVNNAK